MSVDWSKFEEVGGGNENYDMAWPAKGIHLSEGDFVEGRYTKKLEKQGPKQNSNIYVLESEDGKKIGVWGGAVLDSRFQDIAEGKLVAIEFLGKKKSKSGTEFNNFKVGTGIDFVGDENEHGT